MVEINSTNVINMLIATFHISNKPPSAINNRKVELSNSIKQIIIDNLEDFSLTTEYITTLEFKAVIKKT